MPDDIKKYQRKNDILNQVIGPALDRLMEINPDKYQPVADKVMMVQRELTKKRAQAYMDRFDFLAQPGVTTQTERPGAPKPKDIRYFDFPMKSADADVSNVPESKQEIDRIKQNQDVLESIKGTPDKELTDDQRQLRYLSDEKYKKEFDNFSERAGSALLSGSAKLGADISRLPALAYTIAVFPYNALNLIFGSEEQAASAPDWLKNNAIAKYYDQQQLLWHDKTEQEDQGIIEHFKEGNISKGIANLGLQVVENLPLQIALLTAGYASIPTKISLPAMSAISAAGKLKEVENVKMPELQKTLAIITHGMAEGAFEELGTVNIARIGKELIQKYGKEEGTKILKSGVANTLKEILKKFYPITAPIVEGIEEYSTQIAQNANDIYSGIKPDISLFDGAINAFLVGSAAGAVTTTPAYLAQLGAKGKKQAPDLTQDARSEQPTVETPLPEAETQQQPKAEATEDVYKEPGEQQRVEFNPEEMTAAMADLEKKDSEAAMRGKQRGELQRQKMLEAAAKRKGLAGPEIQQIEGEQAKKTIPEPEIKAAEAEKQTEPPPVISNKEDLKRKLIDDWGYSEEKAQDTADIYDAAMDWFATRTGKSKEQLYQENFEDVRYADKMPERMAAQFEKATAQAQISEEPDFKLANKDEFNDTALELATLDLEDDQVRYPNIDNKKQTNFGGGTNYELYLIGREQLPQSGPFEIAIKNDNGDYIGFLRGTKSNKTISLNLIHIQENYRRQGIGTDIYENLLKDGYTIKSDKEITDDTYSLYDRLYKQGYEGLIYSDGRIGLRAKINQTLEPDLNSKDLEGDAKALGRAAMDNPEMIARLKEKQQAAIAKAQELKKSGTMEERAKHTAVTQFYREALEVAEKKVLFQEPVQISKIEYLEPEKPHSGFGKGLTKAKVSGVVFHSFNTLPQISDIIEHNTEQTLSLSTMANSKRLINRKYTIVLNIPEMEGEYTPYDADSGKYGHDEFRTWFKEKDFKKYVNKIYLPQEDIDFLSNIFDMTDEEMFSHPKYSTEQLENMADFYDNWNYKIEPIKEDENLIEKYKDQPLFQQAKGATEFLSNGKAIVHAFESRDESTGIHELSHVWLMMMQKYGMNYDLKIVLDWAGSKTITSKTQEKFARGFERYMRDGKAPNEKMRRIFENFKQWLTEIYAKIKGSAIDVKLSPAMRDLFDEMMGGEKTRTVKERKTTSKTRDVKTVQDWVLARMQRLGGKGILPEHLKEHGINQKEEAGIFLKFARRNGLGLDDWVATAIEEQIIRDTADAENDFIDALRGNRPIMIEEIEDISERLAQQELEFYYNEALNNKDIPEDMTIDDFKAMWEEMLIREVDDFDPNELEDVAFQPQADLFAEQPKKKAEKSAEQQFIDEKAKEGIDVTKIETMQTKLEKREELKKRMEEMKRTGQQDIFIKNELDKQKTLFQAGADQTETAAFKRWFGDSKVVDENGKPLVVYHGTPNGEFTTFKKGKFEGYYFTNNENVAENFAGTNSPDVKNPKVMEVYLSLQNPIVFKSGDWADLSRYVAQAKQNNNDGVIGLEVSDWGGVSTQYVVFKNTQIKSATANRGTFDQDNPNILFESEDAKKRITDQQIIISNLKKAEDKKLNYTKYLIVKYAANYADAEFLQSVTFQDFNQALREAETFEEVAGWFKQLDDYINRQEYGPANYADMGGYDVNRPSIIQMPELVQFVRAIMGGKYPQVKEKISRKAGVLGLFMSSKNGRIRLRADIFKDPELAKRVLAHEIGHLIDWLPDKNLTRGNILGHIAALLNYSSKFLEEYPGSPNKVLTDQDVERLRREAEREVKEQAALGDKEIIEQIVKDIPIYDTTGLKPEDILQIWNDNTSREKNPELYKYIAGLNAAQKKSVLQQVLKGIVDDQIQKQFGGKRIVGYDRVIETVRRVEKAPRPSKAEIERHFKKMLADEVEKRKLYTAKAIRDELKKLTQIWKPFDVKADKKYTAYRHSSEELYADAISVLLNDSRLLQDTAPEFYRAFFNYLERRPQVQAEYNKIQQLLKRSDAELYRERDKNIEEMFDNGERIWKERFGETGTLKERLFDGLWKIHRRLIDKNSELIRLRRTAIKQGKYIDVAKDPVYWIEELPYIQSRIFQYYRDIQNIILDAVKKDQITERLISKYMYLRRSTTEREELANPLGMDKAEAEKQLAGMKKDLGDAKYNKLVAIVEEFQKLRHSYVIPYLKESGMYSDELMKKLEDNQNYATFSVSHYLEDQYGKDAANGIYTEYAGIGKIHKQIGTLAGIQPAFTATILKDAALMRAAHRKMAAENVIDFLQQNFADEIEEAERDFGTGRYRNVNDANRKTLFFMDKGKIKAFNINKDIADSFNRDAHEANILIRIFWNLPNSIVKSLLVTKNPFWAIWNIQRDLRGAAQKLPGASVVKMLKYAVKAMPDAWNDVFRNMSSDTVRKMYEDNQLLVGRYYKSSSEPEETELDRTLEGMGVLPYRYRNIWHRGISSIGHILEMPGKYSERLMKIAGAKYLADLGIDDKKASHIIRTRAGSPDFYRKNSMFNITNNVWLFSNAGKEGWRGSWESFKEDRSAFIWKTLKYDLLPKTAMYAASIGMFGLLGDDDDEIKHAFDNIPERDKMNYQTVPIGFTKNNKTMYLVFPHDFTGQVIGGLFWQAMNANNAKDIQSIFDFIHGGTPYSGLNPTLKLYFDIGKYLMGKNIYDEWLGRDAIPELEFEAGGWRKFNKFASYEFNNFGSSLIYRFPTDDVNREQTTLEKVYDQPMLGPFVKRVLRVSDRGRYEKLVEASTEERSRRANELLDIKDVLVKHLNKVEKPNVTDARNLYVRMKFDQGFDIKNFGIFWRKYKLLAIYKENDAEISAFLRAQTEDEELAILKEMYKDQKVDKQFLRKFKQDIDRKIRTGETK